MARARRSPRTGLSDQAFLELYDAQVERVTAFFVRRVVDPEIALDLTAETFAQALRSRTGFRGEPGAPLNAWLYAIASHQLSRYFRRGRLERTALKRAGIDPPHPTEADIERIEELASIEDLRAAVRREMSALPPEQRRAIELRIVNELPYSSIAQRLDISEPTARARVSRGLRSMQAALAGVNEETAR
ncbi:RNA polymerase sigma factor [Thermoleophilia bacterium SCSIO 60948]|nr:RNA polymerase sigma factor [Thermoleophilia bacterium SCSIO 60948]